MKTSLLLTFFIASLALALNTRPAPVTDQDKLSEFMWGLDFGIGATTEFNIDHSTMNLLLTGEYNFTPLKKIEHELVNGLGYSQDSEIAMWHFRIIAEILKTDVVEKFYSNESMYGDLRSKWMEHIEGMLNI